MKKSITHTLAVGTLLAGLASSPAFAFDDNTLSQALGGGVGGALGAAVGNEIGGQKGALIGAAAGAAGGSWVIQNRHDDPYYRHDRGDHGPGYGRYSRYGYD